jgi:hypothetical protein
VIQVLSTSTLATDVIRNEAPGLATVKRIVRFWKSVWNNRNYRSAEFSIGYAFFALVSIGLAFLLCTRLSSLQTNCQSDAAAMESESLANQGLNPARSPQKFAPPEQWEYSWAWSLGMYAAMTIVAILLMIYAYRRQAERLKRWSTKRKVRKSVSGAKLESSMAKLAAAKSHDGRVLVIHTAP